MIMKELEKNELIGKQHYYPKQIPHFLNHEFKNHILYKEHIIQELNEYCMCIWEMKTQKKSNKIINNNVLPDACIDIVIDFIGKKICFAGFSSDTEVLKLSEEIDFLGVRMKPGAFYALFHVDASKIMDNPIPFNQIDEEYDLTPIYDISESSDRITYFKNYLLKRIASKPDPKFIQMVDRIYMLPQDQRVLMLAESLGYNQKQLFRIFKKNYGVSPKVLLNILRLQKCLTLIIDDNIDLMDIAVECGFYDQSHFIKEIKRYTNISPLKFLENLNK